jgi:hypothetical protein
MSRLALARYRTILALVGAAALAAGIAATSFAVLASLTWPQPGSAVAVRVIARLDDLRLLRSVVLLPGRSPLRASCLAHTRSEQLAVGPTLHLVLDGTRIVEHGRASRIRLAEVDVSGCPHLLADELAARLDHGRPTTPQPGWAEGRPVYRFRLGDSNDVVELAVARRSLLPLALTFASPSLRASSVIVFAAPRR